MKVRSILGIAAILCASAVYGNTLADWTFETSQPAATNQASIGPISPETGSGSAYASHASSSTDYSSPAGNGSSHSFSANNWAANDYFEFKTATTGYDHISLTFDQVSSSTGPGDFELQYSLDGNSYTLLQKYNVSSGSFSSSTSDSSYNFSYDLSTTTDLNNQSAIYFRMIMADNNAADPSKTLGSTGTDKLDNVIISGHSLTAVPLPAASGAGIVLVGLLAASRRRAGDLSSTR